MFIKFVYVVYVSLSCLCMDIFSLWQLKTSLYLLWDFLTLFIFPVLISVTPKQFVIFTVIKHFSLSLHLLQSRSSHRLGLQLYSKRDSGTGVFLWILRIFLKTPILQNSSGWLLLSIKGATSSTSQNWNESDLLDLAMPLHVFFSFFFIWTLLIFETPKIFQFLIFPLLILLYVMENLLFYEI